MMNCPKCSRFLNAENNVWCSGCGWGAETGTEVCYVVRAGSYKNEYRKARLMKVTKSGQMTAALFVGGEPLRFNSDGHELGGSERHGRYLSFEVEKIERAIAERDAQDKRDCIVAEIQKRLGEWRYFAHSYNITPARKAELAALIESLEFLPETAPVAADAEKVS